ncbi:MAG: acyltransferase [Deltaproteobacteria bacterium]|nr:acyltransferase [Deltaproteobacteria bacterium]
MEISKENIAYLEENYGKNILPLSNFENNYFPGTNPLEILLFYKKGTSLEKLEERFFKTVEHYNIFSSRLIMIDDKKFALQYCTDGIVKSILPPVDETFDNININDINKMIEHVKTLPGKPLLAVTGIPIKDGVLAGISCSHAVGDGISLMLFLYAWNCMIEGNEFPLPSTQRLFKGKPVSSDKIDKVFTPPLSELSKGIQNQFNNVNTIKTYTTKEYFSDEFLNEIKNKAKSENAKLMISNHQIMTSFLLKKYYNQLLPNTDKIVLRSPISLRDIHPDIDSLYMGSANFNSFTEFTKEEIDKMSILQIAYRLKESMIKMRNEKYAKEISFLSKYGLEINIDILNKNHPPYDIETNIVSSNLTHLNDLESLFLGPNIGSILYIGLVVQTGFTMLKEKSGRIFAQITSRYPFK